MEGDEYYWSDEEEGEEMEDEDDEDDDDEDDEDCTEWSCEVQEGLCVCGERSCDPQSHPLSEDACQDLLVQANCSNVTCPEVPVPSCPEDSILTEPFTLPGSCCPLVPSMCTCQFENCTSTFPTCPMVSKLSRLSSQMGFLVLAVTYIYAQVLKKNHTTHEELALDCL
ncbi:cysteine-rich motor neuron 1 protein-like [Clupea harengus]|uniref:Cysteine-rich motor neuron 1 protein-like n=1 Tax=Clupea harengus TaxID=7950 RepID=A0A8M1KHS6_CLUHA|nr:cysteine-rich motor neuron 1 protein-like [Clupea harengus]